jgi:DNA-binding MarR family transcriptional regulator
MNVRNMNGKNAENQDSYKSLLLLDEISKGEPLSQRVLSKKLNIALGLVNSYLKNLVSKGYVTISQIPAKRYVYYLTPTGFAEKTRLTYHHLQNYTNLYRNARKDFRKLFQKLYTEGVRRVIFAGVDELAEIAYMSLQEMDIELAGVADDSAAGRRFFKTTVIPFRMLSDTQFDRVIITSFLYSDLVYRKLVESKVPKEMIHRLEHLR